MRALVVALIACGCSYTGRGFDPDASGGDDIDGPIDAEVADAEVADAEVADAEIPDATPDAEIPDATPDAHPDAAGCPAGYAPIGSSAASMYRTVAGFSQWRDAEADCEDDGAGTHLAVIDSAAESALVDDQLFGTLWLGISDRVTEGTFLGVTGAPAPYLPWAPLQPDNFFDEDCVSMSESGNYGDADCTALRGYVCECDGIAPDPTAF